MKGSTHSLADKFSLYPNNSVHCPDIEDGVCPTVASRSLRLKSSENISDDPHVMKVAEIGNTDDDYNYIKKFIKIMFPITSVDKQSDLCQIQGEYNTLSLHNTEGGEIVTKNANKVLIP